MLSWHILSCGFGVLFFVDGGGVLYIAGTFFTVRGGVSFKYGYL